MQPSADAKKEIQLVVLYSMIGIFSFEINFILI